MAKLSPIHIFEYKKSLYLLVGKLKKYLYISKDGLNFQLTKTKPPRLKNLTEKPSYIHLLNQIAPGSEFIDLTNITIQAVFKRKNDQLIFFHHYKNSTFEVGVIALDNDDKVIWRHSHPVWQSPPDWQYQSPTFIGLVSFKKKYLSFWNVGKLGIVTIVYPDYQVDKQIEIKQSNFLYKVNENPLISPNHKNPWEAFTTFNPAAVYEANKVHLLYRAQGHDYRSVLGYAESQDGVNISYKQPYPCYVPTKPFEIGKIGYFSPQFVSGGGCEGCEDPRITTIGDRVYMTYVAFNGWDPPRIALTSIKLTDFLAKRWLWQAPVLISPPNVVDKSACLLPEKVAGKYVIFHRIFPNILIDFVDSLEFKPGQYLKGQYKITPRSPLWWDSRKIGVAAPPLKTKLGWLLIYQAVDDKDSSHYKVGAMLLKLNDPTQVLYRSSYPIMEPDKWYDNQGFKAGVVYPCGAVIIKDTLFVYYGGADSHVCVATANLDSFLEQMVNSDSVSLKQAIIKKI